jgi:hypothetical protein
MSPRAAIDHRLQTLKWVGNGELEHKNSDLATHLHVVRGISQLRPIILA